MCSRIPLSSISFALVLFALLPYLSGCGGNGSSGSAFIGGDSSLLSTGEASLSGTVRDSISAQPVPGAACTLTIKTKGFLKDFIKAGDETYTTTSGSDGRYSFGGLHAGTGTLQVKKDGFVPCEMRDIAIAGSATTADPTVIQLSQWSSFAGVNHPFDPTKWHCTIHLLGSPGQASEKNPGNPLQGYRLVVKPDGVINIGYYTDTTPPVIDWNAVMSYSNGQAFVNNLEPNVNYSFEFFWPGSNEPFYEMTISSETSSILVDQWCQIPLPQPSPSPSVTQSPYPTTSPSTNPYPVPTVSPGSTPQPSSGGGTVPSPTPSPSPTTAFTGKIVIGGDFMAAAPYNTSTFKNIGRVNSDGSPDPTFNVGTFNGEVTKIIPQADGKILVSGVFSTFNGVACNKIVRLNSNGSLDSSFTCDGLDIQGYSGCITLLPSNSILLGGDLFYKNAGGDSVGCYLAEIAAGGSFTKSLFPSETYPSNLLVDGAPSTVARQSDGKILVGCQEHMLEQVENVSSEWSGIYRLTEQGTIDDGFRPWEVKETENGETVVKHIAYDTYYDGTVGPILWSTTSITPLQDGKTLVWGITGSHKYMGGMRKDILRLDSNGCLDGGFALNGDDDYANAGVTGMAMLDNGKIFITTDERVYHTSISDGLLRLNDDGTPDGSFNPAFLGPTSNMYAYHGALCTFEDNLTTKVIVSATSWTDNRTYLLCCTADGARDSSFNFSTGLNGQIDTIARQPDGKILFGGSFEPTTQRPEYNHIARLNADGSFDTGFSTGTGTNGTVNALNSLPDGRLLIGGSFTTVNGFERPRLAELTSNGAVYFNINPLTGLDSHVKGTNGPVHVIAGQADGRILLGGAFTTAANNKDDLYMSQKYIARLAPDNTDPLVYYFETPDTITSFNTGAGPASPVNAVLPLPGGQIMLGGEFNQYDNNPLLYMAKINIFGALNTLFTAGANNIVHALARQNDGKILVGGQFTQYWDTDEMRMIDWSGIARLDTLGFGGRDIDFDIGTGANGTVRVIVCQPDGKILIGGDFTFFNGTQKSCIARLNSTGILDPYFGTVANGRVSAITLQPDGKILIGGEFTAVNGTTCNNLARLNADGSLDTGFGNSQLNGNVQCIMVK